jgi:hypothetical protein
MKKLIAVVGTIFVIAGLVFVGVKAFYHVDDQTNGAKVEYAHGDFAIDMDNPYQVVGSADYCFVARVDAVEGVEYRDVVEKETSLTETEKVGTPYTKYKVTILQNIKGKLSRNTPITVTKFGGIKEDQKSVLLFEGDALMEEGNVYVLLAHKQPDGSLLTCGPNTTVEVTDLDDTKNVTTTKELKSGIIEKYKEYYLHEEKVE